MKTILTYRTFDLFHVGHVKLLSRLKQLGDRLVVGLSTDEFNREKGKNVIIPFEHRLIILKSCRYVDKIFPEESWEQKEDDILREQATIMAMGDDWAGKFDYLDGTCKVIYLPRTKDVSTTDIKHVLNNLHNEKFQEIKNQVERLYSLVTK